MAKKPSYIREYKDQHGVSRLEFRRKGCKGWPLRQPLRSPEFWEDYNAAIKGEIPPGYILKYGNKPDFWRKSEPPSLRWLIDEYKSSATFRRFAQSTQKVRRGILDELSIKYGKLPYASLNHRAVLKLRDEKADRPEAANALVKAIRQVYKYALQYNIEGVTIDPTRDIPKIPSHNPNGFYAWTAEEVDQFKNTHPIGTKARLALGLMLFGGCARRSDVITLGKQHITKDGRLQYRQFKGRNNNPSHIDIQVITELQHIIDASPCGELTFLVTEFGKPFTSNGFGNWFKKQCIKAGLPHCSAHGVRKAAAAKLAELGCTDHEIMAIGGWKTLKEVQRYTKGARKRILSDNAMVKVQADINRTKVSNLSSDGT